MCVCVCLCVRVSANVCMLPNVRIHVMSVSFDQNILTGKNTYRHMQDSHETHTCVHVLSALAKRVPSSASTTSAKSSQADGSNERSAEIIQ